MVRSVKILPSLSRRRNDGNLFEKPGHRNHRGEKIQSLTAPSLAVALSGIIFGFVGNGAQICSHGVNSCEPWNF
jgi:hypothetical protein